MRILLGGGFMTKSIPVFQVFASHKTQEKLTCFCYASVKLRRLQRLELRKHFRYCMHLCCDGSGRIVRSHEICRRARAAGSSTIGDPEGHCPGTYLSRRKSS